MTIDVLTIFPEMFQPLRAGLIGKAFDSGVARLNLHDIRDFCPDARGTVDDRPYGGGPGMVMKAEPIFKAVESVIPLEADRNRAKILVMSPQGARYTQEKARVLAGEKHLVIICGRYEGIDERVAQGLGAEEISIGDYVLCGGEMPAMVIIESVVRLLPGTLGEESSTEEESFAGRLLEYPQYTRPPEFRGMKVPPVLLSGDHGRIRSWRREQALKRTFERRKDLLGEENIREIGDKEAGA